MKVYLNHAAAGLASPRVLQAMHEHLLLESECGAYVAAERALPLIEQCRKDLASLLNCSFTDIAFTDSASRAWHRILACFDFKPGDEIWVSPCIWGGNYFTLLQLQDRAGLRIQCMPVDSNGNIDLAELELQLSPRVRLMEVTLAPSGWDTWQPAQQLAGLARAHGIALAVDASQALGQRKIDVTALGCDFLFASGRKWLAGPRGTGVLYVNPSTANSLCPLGLDQHTGSVCDGRLNWLADARRFELSEFSVAGRVGLGVAVKQTLARLENDSACWLTEHANAYREALARLPDVSLPAIHGDHGGIVTFRHHRHSPVAVRDFLRHHQIEVGVHPASYMPLHAGTRQLGDCVRISPNPDDLNADSALNHFFEKLSGL